LTGVTIGEQRAVDVEEWVEILVPGVVIRTFLSFMLEVEINGRWPWQQEGDEPAVDSG
jgi:hypothetical protein